jgi:DNA-binding transcriptional LysR family regulator
MSHADSSQRALSVSIRQLKILETVAQTHSLRGASASCHITQPTVTYAIARLEERLGIRLLDRRANGTFLNIPGAIFQRRVARMFGQFEQALMELGVPGTSATVKRIAGRITRSQARCLIAAVEYGSIATAARVLATSQTTMQRRARKLEQTLRAPLLLQTASGVVASPAAAEFASRLKLALREIEWGLEEIEAAGGNGGGEVVVGAMPLSGSLILASALNQFGSENPDADIRVVNGNAKEMLRYLRRGDVDLVVGLVVEPTPPGVVARVLGKTPYVVVARHGHPLTEQRNVTLEELSRFDWVVGTPGAHRRRSFDELFTGQRQPRARIATCSLPMIRVLLANSDSLTLLTSYEMLYEDDLLAPVAFGPVNCVPSMGVTLREDWLPTQLQRSFLDLMIKTCGSHFSPLTPCHAGIGYQG